MQRYTLLLIALCCSLFSAASAQSSAKRIAITLDDLPYAGPLGTLENIQATHRSLLYHIDRYQVPVVGFVNEQSLAVANEEAARLAIMQQWLDAGLELANHTYSHPSLSKTPLEAYQQDVIKGEKLTKSLSLKAGMPYRYFRHPYTHTGPTAEIKGAFEDFLKQRGYTIAPFTIESSDYIFNYIYALAKAEGDTATMRYAGEEYVRHTARMTDFFEMLTKEVIGKPIPHIYLAHVNQLHADYFDELMEMFKNKGYSFISLEEALKDGAYQQPDNYVAANGISWLHRWNNKSRGEWLKKEPELPERIAVLYQQYQEKQKKK